MIRISLLLKYAILALLLFVVVFILSYLSEKKILSRKTEYSDMKWITDKPEPEKEKERLYENRPSFLIYNRIPKCGSTTLLKLVKRLSVRNNFDYIPSKIYNKERLAAEKLGVVITLGVRCWSIIKILSCALLVLIEEKMLQVGQS